MAALLNRARMTTATTGTGTITLGSAVDGYASFSEAGAVNATVYSYCIEDGDDFEIGVGTYTSSGTTFSRDTVTLSKISGTAGTTKLTLSGNAEVFVTGRTSDLGDAFGPQSSTDGGFAKFDGITGKLLKDSASVVAVADGGTGRSSHTAYAVLCGGTTSTGAQQSVAGLGTSGQVLTSNGSGALPTFQDASGGDGQPVPTTSTFAVDTMAVLVNISGSAISAAASVAGSNLKALVTNNSGVPETGGSGGTTQTGTWKNVSGASIPAFGGVGLFVRTA